MSRRWPIVAAVLPALLVAAMNAGILVVAVASTHPRWPHDSLNLTEATAAEDTAEVIRLVERGDDVNARRPVRAGMLAAEPLELTPLEAAVLQWRPELVGYLIGRGARPDPVTAVKVWCWAQVRGDREVIAALAPVRPASDLCAAQP